MDENAARELARGILRPCGLLGYLTGRGAWWEDATRLALGKRAVAHVMGNAYFLLTPVWRLHPSLDPGQFTDPLGLSGQSHALEDLPRDLQALLADLEQAVRDAMPTLEEHFPDHRVHIRSAGSDVDAAIAEARRALQPPAVADLSR